METIALFRTWRCFRCSTLAAAVLCLIVGAVPTPAVQVTAATGTGGVLVKGVHPAYTISFGNVNGFGYGSPSAGVSMVPMLPSGVLYTTSFRLGISGLSTGQSSTVRGWLSTPFGTNGLQFKACPLSCGSLSSWIAINNSAVIFSDVPNGTFDIMIGLYVPVYNGPNYSPTDSATFAVSVRNDSTGSLDQLTLALSPAVQVQSALGLTLSTQGGLPINTGSDFATSFGLVNGLGLSPGTGLTSQKVSGGALYATPYAIQPTFTGFSSTTGTMSAWVSSDFATPTQLGLWDASASAGPWQAISTTSSAPTTLVSVTNGSTVTRYLGLFVSSSNGASAVPGSTVGGRLLNATLTLTLSVP